MTFDRFLKPTLLVDGIASGGMGLALAALAGFAAPILGLPEGLLRGAGLALVPFAAFVLFTATRPVPDRRTVAGIAAVNVGWVVASIVALMLPQLQPGVLGVAFMISQAALVAIFAELQIMALRRGRKATAKA